MQQKNLLLFFVVSFLLFVGYVEVRRRFFPPPIPPKTTQISKEEEKTPPSPVNIVSAVGQAGGLSQPWPVGFLAEIMAKAAPIHPVRKLPLPTLPSVTPEDRLITLGNEAGDSPFHLRVKLDPRGAGVRSVLLNKFQATDAMGRPAWKDKANKVPEPLELVPDEANQINPSNLLFLFDPTRPSDDRPLDTLGKIPWQMDSVERKPEGETVSFHTEVKSLGLIITKTYSLKPGEYHLGLDIKLERTAEAANREEIRYQFTGAHGLPIEGKWYTNTFRTALIALQQDGGIIRDYQDLRQISHLGGGNRVVREPKSFFRYAGIAVQYFASVIVVDNEQARQNFLEWARPTLELTVIKGQVKSIDPEERSFVLFTGPGREETFYVLPKPDDEGVDLPRVGQLLAVTHYTDSHLRHIAEKLTSEADTQPLWVDDPTVRVTSEPLKLPAGTSVVHKYLLYNGPVKPSLLSQETGVARVDPKLLERYVDTLHLNTLTDYHSPGWLGSFANSIYWSQLIIKFTNLMHWVLGGLHSLVHSYGLCIILLTVMVRGLMFPLSRKQALTSLKMQALAPQLKKLAEKYKDDKQALGLAQMEMYRKNGVNPFGTCWLLLLQMPVFMGLYYALQESIYFRLAPFWPTWIINLAAPDMLFEWGNRIPWMSRPGDYGSLLYLGPFFNLLPVIAVVLMLGQQKMMAPPPTDDQQRMQMTMMKWMMIFMGLMFYKVAAGLCLYFIASSVWGFAERKLLPRLKPAVGTVSADEAFQEMTGQRSAPSSSSVAADRAGGRSTEVTDRKGRPGRNRKKERGRQEVKGTRSKADTPEEAPGPLGRLRKRISDWWADILEKAKKK